MRLARWAGILLVLVLLIPAFVIVALEEPRAEAAIPSDFALSDIPAGLLPVYREAAKQTCDMPWEVLAGVGGIESSHGRSTAPGVHSGTNSAGAAGPMQFMPGTWQAYKVDGDKDGDTDVYDPVDSIWSAANLLCANGAGEGSEDRIRDALFAYNHSQQYVQDVLNLAARYRAAGSGVGQGADATALLANPNLVLTPRARKDLEDRIISPK
ncbi:MAG TPA: lytic transglycosylase domain-containing protein, partial [Actinomycetota bacterium]|nr:lytic transglycosylase domain-containing protein [Actinomycetota bacterium]